MRIITAERRGSIVQGIVEATREELRVVLPETLTVPVEKGTIVLLDRLPEGPTRYAFGCWVYHGCECPVFAAKITTLHTDVVEAIRAYDRYCIGFALLKLASEETRDG